MAQNPLQQFFRQPRIYIGLPSQGIYNKPETISGDVSHMPVYGMTGMDEILLKTPDALINGDSTVKVIASCCPAITDPWDICSLDLDLILASIRIATYGNELTVGHTCTECNTPSEYNLDLVKLIDHYARCTYDNRIVFDQFEIIVKPLTYKQSTDFALRNFQIQQQLQQVEFMTEDEEKREASNKLFEDLAALRNEVFAAGIESVNTGEVIVTERAYIIEWIANSDRKVIKLIKDHIEANQRRWTPPEHEVKCENCGHIDGIKLDLDQSNFFADA